MAIEAISNAKLFDKVQSIAEANNIEEDELKQQLQELYNSIDEDLPDEAKKTRAYLRFIGAFRSRSNKNLIIKNGFVFARQQDQDKAGYRRREIARYIEKNGAEEATKNGYIDENGNYLYAEDDLFNEGIIPDDTVRGKYYAIMVNPDTKKLEFASIFLGGFNVSERISMFQELDLNLIDAGVDGNIDNNPMYYYDSFSIKEPKEFPISQKEADEIIKHIEDNLPEIFEVVSNVQELEKYATDNADIRNTCALMQGYITTKNPMGEKGAYFTGMDMEIEDFDCWLPIEVFESLPEIPEASPVYFMISSYINKDGEPKYTAVGILPYIEEY